MWRGISRAWSVGANEMGEMAVCCVERWRVDPCGSGALARLSGSILALRLSKIFRASVLSATFKL